VHILEGVAARQVIRVYSGTYDISRIDEPMLKNDWMAAAGINQILRALIWQAET
jgi:hypothetical protein